MVFSLCMFDSPSAETYFLGSPQTKSPLTQPALASSALSPIGSVDREGDTIPPEAKILVSFAWFNSVQAAITKISQAVWLNQQTFISHGSGGREVQEEGAG